MNALSREELIDQRYRIVRRIGQGAWATVYEGVDTHFDRRVAIKILNDDLIDNATLKRRFVHEAEAAIRIDSPFVVSVHAVGTLRTPEGKTRSYIVMELLEGEDLGRRLERVGALGEEQAVEFAIQAASGLAHAHACGVLHRDIKPENLFLVRGDDDELLKIVDLGISKLEPIGSESFSLTRTNVVLGSPAYMSPEQCRGARHMDHRSDIYSLGVVLFECLTGVVPHDGDNVNHLMFKIALEDVPDPRLLRPRLDPGLAEIVLHALQRHVDDRIQSASAFRERLLEWGAKRGARVPPTPPSKMRIRVPVQTTARLDLDVTLDEDDAIATLTREAAPLENIPETTTTGGIAQELRAAEAADIELVAPSALRRRLPVLVAIAASVLTVTFAIAGYPWKGHASSDPAWANGTPQSAGSPAPAVQPSTPPRMIRVIEVPPPLPLPTPAPTATPAPAPVPAVIPKPAPPKPKPVTVDVDGVVYDYSTEETAPDSADDL